MEIDSFAAFASGSSLRIRLLRLKRNWRWRVAHANLNQTPSNQSTKKNVTMTLPLFLMPFSDPSIAWNHVRTSLHYVLGPSWRKGDTRTTRARSVEAKESATINPAEKIDDGANSCWIGHPQIHTTCRVMLYFKQYEFLKFGVNSIDASRERQQHVPERNTNLLRVDEIFAVARNSKVEEEPGRPHWTGWMVFYEFRLRLECLGTNVVSFQTSSKTMAKDHQNNMSLPYWQYDSIQEPNGDDSVLLWGCE